MVVNKKRVLVTGGSRGIGKAIVDEYRDRGYLVYAPTRKELDLSQRDSIEKFIEENKEKGYDIIINNAGCNFINTIEHVLETDLNVMLNVNLIAPVRLLRGFVPIMKEQEFGRIVNIGSIWGVISKAGRSIYSATKHGIHGITNTLALELAPYNILVNTVCPGQTLTELTLQNNSPNEIKQMERDIPLGRLAKPEEIAKIVFLLGNEENTYITGQQIVVDGGLSIQ